MTSPDPQLIPQPNGLASVINQSGLSVLGIGTDIIECERIGEMLTKHDQIFIQKVFTPYEIEYCGSRKAAAQHYAGRWAAKEAILKAIGTGWAKGIKWTDIDIQNQPGGAPVVRIGGVAKDLCEKCGIKDVLVSISHCRLFATAFATAIGTPGLDPGWAKLDAAPNDAT